MLFTPLCTEGKARALCDVELGDGGWGRGGEALMIVCLDQGCHAAGQRLLGSLDSGGGQSGALSLTRAVMGLLLW